MWNYNIQFVFGFINYNNNLTSCSIPTKPKALHNKPLSRTKQYNQKDLKNLACNHYEIKCKSKSQRDDIKIYSASGFVLAWPTCTLQWFPIEPA